MNKFEQALAITLIAATAVLALNMNINLNAIRADVERIGYLFDNFMEKSGLIKPE